MTVIIWIIPTLFIIGIISIYSFDWVTKSPPQNTKPQDMNLKQIQTPTTENLVVNFDSSNPFQYVTIG